jgi:hypothetical protein
MVQNFKGMVTQDFQYFLNYFCCQKNKVEKSLLLLIFKKLSTKQKSHKYLPIHIRTSQHNRSIPDPSFYWGLKRDLLET